MHVTNGTGCGARRLCCLLLISLITSPLVANVDPKKGRVTGNPNAGKYSPEDEVKIGQQGVAEIERQLPLLPASHPMSKYISALGLQLAAKAPGYKFPYAFKVVKEKSVNAFALPGGPVYVHTGLIAAATEAELAGVLGHEISHVVMRHSARQAERQMKAQLPLAILGGVLGAGVGGWAASLAQMGVSFTAGSVFMKYSRDAETEADMVGAQIIYDAGYDPEAIVSFFRKLEQQQGGSSGPQFLASHPNPGNRAQDIARILSRFPAKQYRTGDSPGYVAAKKALTDASTAANEQASAAQKPPEMRRLALPNIASVGFTLFQHRAYAIRYPANWRLRGNAESSVTIYPEGGWADGTLGYGTIISGFQPKSSRKQELDDAVRELVADIQQTNPGLRLVNSPQAIMLNGHAARRLDWLGKSAVRENGQVLDERVRLVALQAKGGIVLYLVLVAPEADFSPWWPVYEKILNSLQAR